MDETISVRFEKMYVSTDGRYYSIGDVARFNPEETAAILQIEGLAEPVSPNKAVPSETQTVAPGSPTRDKMVPSPVKR